MRKFKLYMRVRYRYLNKGRPLYGYVDYMYRNQDVIIVQMDDGTRLVRRMSSWDIVNEK